MSSTLEHLTLTVAGVRLHVAVQGEGPLVVLLHGFPELWSAWHHQMPALAKAGYRVAAPDLRGFGQSDAPEHPHQYTVLHNAGDVIGIIQALGERSAVVVGHDWGAPIAWTTALIRPDVVTAVAGLSSPHRARSPQPPMQMLRAAGLTRFYWFYFQTPEAAREMDRDVAKTLRTMLFGVSGEAPPPDENSTMVPDGGLLAAFPSVAEPPKWIDREHFDRLVAEYTRTGFQKPLYLYHNFDLSWELLAAWSGKQIEQPALFLGGEKDPTLFSAVGKQAVANLPNVVPRVRTQLFPGAGHWLQQERPAEVTQALLEFLREHAPQR